MNQEQNKIEKHRDSSWKVLLPVGVLIWAIGGRLTEGTAQLLGALMIIAGLIIGAIGVVRLITYLVKRNKG